MSGRTLDVRGDEAIVARAEAGGALLEAPESHAHGSHDLSSFKYVMIFLVLVVVTALEVATSYIEGLVPNWVVVALLLFWGVIKFVLVAMYYMHLKGDRPMFWKFFVMGLAATMVLYTVALASLHAF